MAGIRNRARRLRAHLKDLNRILRKAAALSLLTAAFLWASPLPALAKILIWLAVSAVAFALAVIPDATIFRIFKPIPSEDLQALGEETARSMALHFLGKTELRLIPAGTLLTYQIYNHHIRVRLVVPSSQVPEDVLDRLEKLAVNIIEEKLQTWSRWRRDFTIAAWAGNGSPDIPLIKSLPLPQPSNHEILSYRASQAAKSAK